ncbi:MAG TPA: ABC transporter permease subunit, partial [Alphaproteobacteria bacterium]|nr:ABC transporter permease subunit [Alphaproteobacteria bacterium]
MTRRIPTGLPVLLALVPLLAACASERYTPGWHVVDPTTPRGYQNFMFLVRGIVLTLQLSAGALVLGVALGLLGALAGRSDSRVLRGVALGYVELLRMLPLFVLLLWIFYALPIAIRGLPPALAEAPVLRHLADMSPFTAAVIALALNAGAFLTEIFRAGIESIP